MAMGYCPACAQDVGDVEACPRCGLQLLLGNDEEELLVDITEVRALFGTVLVAEDSLLISEILKDGLVDDALADTVVVTPDGREFLTRCAELLYADQPFDLAIIDLDMPVLRGEPAAIALRAFEEGCKAQRVPIIFFTARQVDDSLRALMRSVRPAHYLNKGVDASPPRILKRLREIMRALKM